jgi:Ner family transcriptional regulator
MALRRASGRWIVTLLPSGDWHPEEIKAAVRIMGSTLDEISRQFELPEFACRTAIRRSHIRGEQAVAAFLSVSPHEIWPSRYYADGGRIKTGRQLRKPSGRADLRHRQNGCAA